MADVIRVMTAVRLSPAGRDRIDALAKRETNGNRSDMIRKLLAEAMMARDALVKR